MHTVVTGKHVVVSFCVLGTLAAFALMAPPLGEHSDNASADVQATAPSQPTDHTESPASLDDATDATPGKQSDRPASAATHPPAPPAPIPPVYNTPSDVLIEDGSEPALTASLPIDSSMIGAGGARWADAPDADSSRAAIASSTDSLRAAPNDSVRTRRVAERVAAIVSRAVSNPEASASSSTDELPTARREQQPSAFASAVAGTIPEDAADGPGITGLVTDETRTKVGRDFYDAFYDRWQPPGKDFYYTVVVGEQPMPSLGTRVTVRLNQNTVFQTRLQPRSDMIEQAARRAVALTQRRLQSNPTLNVY